MLEYKYNDINIENIEKISKLNTNIICDGDNRIIKIEENEIMKKLEEALSDIEKAFCEIGKQLYDNVFSVVKDCLKNVFYDIKNIFNKKISKKRFIKLLQSQGIQRNTINKIVKNNTEEYTYGRYYNILNKLSKDKKE